MVVDLAFCSFGVDFVVFGLLEFEFGVHVDFHVLFLGSGVMKVGGGLRRVLDVGVGEN